MLSAIAVVLSLLFVGLELRQNTLAQRAQTRQELARGSREVVLTIADNPTLARAYSGLYGGMGRPIDSMLTQPDTVQD